MQNNLQGEKAEPYMGICCKACWYAKGEKCVCRCGGEHHGKGNPCISEDERKLKLKYKNKVGSHDHYYPSAQKYRQLISDPKCLCGFDLSEETIWGYSHSDGWEVEETDELQWLWVKCPKCGYEMSIWKIGVPRDVNIEDIKEGNKSE